jgi:hypothetical protein
MNIAKIVWQLPQLLIGGLFVFLLKATIRANSLDHKNTNIYETTVMKSGVSFGPIIILGELLVQRADVVQHELGHSRQSLLLGPLYLLIVGLPSIVMNLMSRWSLRFGTSKFAMNYYKRWPESWADRLGGVVR